METGEPSHCAQMIQYGGSREEMEHPHHQPTSDVAHGNPRQIEQLSSVLPNLRKPKARNSTQPKRTFKGPKQRPWKDTETSALLKLVNRPEFRPQRRTRSTVAWELIVEAIHGELGSADPAITVKRCKERMKTLTGDRYYKQVRSSLRGNLTEDEWRTELHDCGLTVDWYKAIEEYIQGRPSQGQGMSRMQMQCDPDRNEPTDRPSSSHTPTFSDPSEPVPAMVPTRNPRKSAEYQMAAEGFNDMGTHSRVLKSIMDRKHETDRLRHLRCLLVLFVVQCKRFRSLTELQRSTLLELASLADIFYLWSWFDDFESVSFCCGWLSIVQNRRESAIYDDVIALEKTGLVSFYAGCEDEMGEGSDQDVEVVSKPCIDFPRLRVYEKFFKKVIARNPAYDTRRSVQDELMVKFDSSCAPLGITALNLYDCEELEEADLSCFRMLRHLRIYECPKLHDIIGWELLEELGWLEIDWCSSYHGYPPLQRVPSLQEFHFVRFTSSSDLRGGELDLSGCVRLRRIDIEYSALSSIRGLEGLSSLTELRLWGCEPLENLPDIGHMKDLTHVEIVEMAVAEIKGVEKLSRLRVLDCSDSELQTLPDLSHLPHLQSVNLHGCPVTRDPSSTYYQKSSVQFNKNKYVDVSDVSDDGSDLPC